MRAPIEVPDSETFLAMLGVEPVREDEWFRIQWTAGTADVEFAFSPIAGSVFLRVTLDGWGHFSVSREGCWRIDLPNAEPPRVICHFRTNDTTGRLVIAAGDSPAVEDVSLLG